MLIAIVQSKIQYRIVSFTRKNEINKLLRFQKEVREIHSRKRERREKYEATKNSNKELRHRYQTFNRNKDVYTWERTQCI